MARGRRRSRGLGVLLLGAQLSGALLYGPIARAGPGDSDEGRRAVVIARVLAYDENLVGRVGAGVGLLILYKAGNPASESEALALAGAAKKLENITISSKPFAATSLPFQDVVALEASVDQHGYDAIYLCRGLDTSLRAIKELTRRKRLITIAGNSPVVRWGVTVGVEAGDHIKIFINLKEAVAEGAFFSSHLLRVAEVYR